MKRRALFLDRDGVINVDHGYVVHPDDIEFIDGIFELVALAKSLNYLVVVITNQSGIGRGYYTEGEFHQLMAWLSDSFAKCGGALDKYYFCPDHPEHGVGEFRRDSPLRKPNPGMILAAVTDLNIDLPHSVLVGDNMSDIKAGISAGIGTNLLLSNDPICTYTPVITHLSQTGKYLSPEPSE